VNLHELVDLMLLDTKGASLPAFLPELVLCGTIVLMLVIRVFNWGRRVDPYYLALFGSGLALFFAAPWALADPVNIARTEIFTGMLVHDGLSVFARGMLLLFVVLFAALTRFTGVPDRDDATDFYALVLGATLGMCIMVSANHLMTVFLGIEMASVPSYVLAGMLKTRAKSSEAALKYSVYGAGAAGVMLYGISLLAGVLHSAHLPTMAQQLAANYAQFESGEVMVLVLGGVMVMVGLAFKLSAVPFHFWCPDVFEGASAEVNAFLSVASKAAALVLLVRLAIGFSAVPDSAAPIAAQGKTEQQVAGLFSVADEAKHGDAGIAAEAAPPPADPVAALAPARGFIARLIAFIAVITCTFGNLAAYGQTNIKRLLAYSTIAHAGYMMMPVAAAVALAGADARLAELAVASLAVYIAIYLFMNLGAFAVVAFLRNAIGSEEIADYAGLVRRSPGVVVCFSLILFSLIGLPPLAGFIGKFAIFASLMDGYRVTTDAYLMALLVIGGVNTAISLFYYLRVVKVMTIDPEREDGAEKRLPLMSLGGLYIAAVTAPLVLLIVNWDLLNRWAQTAVKDLIG